MNKSLQVYYVLDGQVFLIRTYEGRDKRILAPRFQLSLNNRVKEN